MLGLDRACALESLTPEWVSYRVRADRAEFGDEMRGKRFC